MEIHLTGLPLTAQDALSLKLVNYVVPQNDLLEKAREILRMINSKAPTAVSKIIECINIFNHPLKDGFTSEAEAFGECFATSDSKEGIRAFFEKRVPQFSGK